MLPELRALFDLPRRFLPGLGARVHGYADKRGIEGIQATGASGVLTLSRSDKSGSMPSLGSGEKPVNLRAGPGVRIHGYGGIHTLERLPVPQPEEESVALSAGIRIEVETVQLYALICAGTLWFEHPPAYLLSEVATEVYENGSVTTTITYDGSIRYYETGETPEECPARTVDSDLDPEFDYGTYESGTSSDPQTSSFTALRVSVIANLHTKATPVSQWFEQTWQRRDWRDASSDAYAPTIYMLSQGSLTDEFGVAAAKACRWRVRNLGQCRAKLSWEKRRDTDDTLLSSGSTEVARGATSSWSDWPSLSADPDDRFSVRFTRVRFDPYLTVA